MVYATARHHQATVWTQDTDFETLPQVRFRKKRDPVRLLAESGYAAVYQFRHAGYP